MSLILQDYTEKSIALFGNTKEYVDELKEFGGRFNPNLTQDGIKTPGWIFSIKRREELTTFIEKVNNNMYVKKESNDFVSDLKLIRNDIDKLIRKYEEKKNNN